MKGFAGRLTVAFVALAASAWIGGPTFARAQVLTLCDPDPPNVPPRPLWSQLNPHMGYRAEPDYQNITTNFQAAKSIRLLASVISKAAQKLDKLSSNSSQREAKGICLCSEAIKHLNVTRAACSVGSDVTLHRCDVTTQAPYPVWLPVDVFKTVKNVAKFLLKQIKFLDKVKGFATKTSGSNAGEALDVAIKVLRGAEAGLANIDELVTLFEFYVNTLTEGFHLGGYSVQRNCSP